MKYVVLLSGLFSPRSSKKNRSSVSQPHLKGFETQARSRAAVGVVLLSVHQNQFCVSTTPKMYTSNVLLCFFFRLAHKLYFCQSGPLCGILFWVCAWFMFGWRNWKLDCPGDWQVSLGLCDPFLHCTAVHPWTCTCRGSGASWLSN